MTPTEAMKILSSLEDYYQKNITDNPIAVNVWLQLFIPLSAADGVKMAQFCLQNHTWLPSPKTLREEFLQSHGSIDFKRELREAIAAYSSCDRRQIRAVPREIAEAIIQAGGANKFQNATEDQWAALEKKYLTIRTESQQKVSLVAIAGGLSQKGLEANHENR
jgi:hypothetical protein